MVPALISGAFYFLPVPFSYIATFARTDNHLEGSYLFFDYLVCLAKRKYLSPLTSPQGGSLGGTSPQTLHLNHPRPLNDN